MSDSSFKRRKKSSIILFVLIIVQLTSSIKTQEYSCQKDEDCLSSFNCIENTCIHKSLFPIKFSEIILMLFLSLLSMIATSAGIGGGPVFNVMFSFVLNFSIVQATPISNFMILVSSVTTFIVGLKNKIENPQMKFVDYKLVVVFCPMLLFGTKLGVILNKILPSLFLNLILILLLSITSYKTYYNALKFKQIEEKAKNPLLDEYNKSNGNGVNTAFKNENFKAIYNDDFFENDDGLNKQKLNGNHPNSNGVMLPFKKNKDFDHNNNAVKNITKPILSGFYDKSVLDIPRIKTLFLLESLMIADQVLEGGDKMPSILGIRRCSFIYWIIFCLFSLCCMYFTWELYCIAKEEYLSNLKSKVNNLFEKSEKGEELEFDVGTPETEKKIGKIFLMCVIAGIMGGMLGIGGGIVMAPLMLGLGVNPQTTSSTSNFILIINSSTGFILFLLSGSFIYDYSLVFGISCFLFSYYGGNYLNQYIARTQKNSLLIFFLFYVMMFSLIVLPINGISRAIYDANNGINVFALNQFC